MEKELFYIFRNFLLEKGYPEKSLLYEFKFSNNDKTFRPDLLIIDTEYNNFLCLIEFKVSSWTKTQFVDQLNSYKSNFPSESNKDIPIYLVLGIDFDFQILEYTDKEFLLIKKEEFPIYETLVAKQITENKIEKNKILKQKSEQEKEKKRKLWLSSIFSVLSIVLGVTVSVFAILFQKKDNNILVSKNCSCDSLKQEIKIIKTQITSLQNNDRKVFNLVAEDKNLELKIIEKRINTIEKGISDNPEKTLSLINLKNSINEAKQENNFTKELNRSEIQSLKNEIDLQNNWLIAVLIAIFGSILSFAIPNIISKINENKKGSG